MNKKQILARAEEKSVNKKVFSTKLDMVTHNRIEDAGKVLAKEMGLDKPVAKAVVIELAVEKFYKEIGGKDVKG